MKNEVKISFNEKLVLRKFNGDKIEGDGKLPFEIILADFNANNRLLNRQDLIYPLQIKFYEEQESLKKLLNLEWKDKRDYKNALTTAGINIIAQFIVNSGSPTNYANANAYIGVGNSTTAFAQNQTDLQAAAGASNRYFQAMSATYPTIASAVLTFRALLSTANGNFAWQEWGVFNASSSGTMLSRKVESLGTKTSAQSWQIDAVLTMTAA